MIPPGHDVAHLAERNYRHCDRISCLLYILESYIVSFLQLRVESHDQLLDLFGIPFIRLY